MKLSRVAVSAVLILGVSGAAAAQPWQDHHERKGEERSEAYQDGFRDGQKDRDHHRSYRPGGSHWEDRAYREAYERGYHAGYGEVREGARWNHEPVAPAPAPVYPPRTAPAPGPMGNQPYKIGYQDGYSQGLGDKNNGHSFRPTQHGYYSDGDHGYSSVWGDKNQYKATYRQGYLAGYQRGYNGR